jgi:hypothetical protein
MPAAMAMVFERACQHAGVPHATCHDLRHPFVTKARRAGIDDFRFMLSQPQTHAGVPAP